MSVFIEFQPVGRRVEVEGNPNILDAARLTVFPDDKILSAPCGGKGRCGRCKVRLIQGQVSPFSEMERELLTTEELEGYVRLACQTECLGNIKVEILPESMSGKQDLQLDGVVHNVEIDPIIRRHVVSTEPPTIANPESAWQQILARLGEKFGILAPTIELELLRYHFPADLEKRSRTISVKGTEIINRFDLFPAPRSLGMAVDLGSTKVAAFLVDLESGDTLASEATMNPQIAFGEDIISRLAYAGTSHDHQSQMQALLVDCTNKLLRDLLSKTGFQFNQVEYAVIVSNSALHHMFLRLPVNDLLNSPYVPVTTLPLELKASSLGVNMAPGASIYFAPLIAGFVGGDHVAMIAASRLFETQDVTLGLDIGTNTEIALSAYGKIICCSCASGPAFEGGNIRHGMRAVEGAIRGVQWSAKEQRLLYQTIGNAPALGLCGSGVIDAVAALVEAGIINRHGLFDSSLCDVRRDPETGNLEYVVASESQSGVARGVTLTQKDVVAIQLAKAAIRAGSQILLAEAGLKNEDLQKVVIAGAFGSSMNLNSAISLGLLPVADTSIYQNIGNAAGSGARLMLLSKKQRTLAEEISRRVHYVELAANAKFYSEFAKALAFAGPHV